MTPALSLYLLAAARAEPLIARQKKGPPAETPPKRPEGGMVWIHVGSGERAESAEGLAARIADERPETGFVATSDNSVARDHGFPWIPRPVDFPRAVEAFLKDWAPSAGVWIGGPIWPVLAAKARQAGIPLLLVNATDALAKGHRGIPGRDLLGLFDGIEACTETDRKALERAARRHVSTIGRLQRSTRPPSHDEAERRRLTAVLQARPVWFAAGATAREAEMLRNAHAIGQGASHRLLLIIRPHDEEAASACHERFGAHRSLGSTLPAGVPVFVADLPEEDGLWYRLASVSFVGGTLGGPAAAVDPFAAAALGSAVLHGPVHKPHESHFAELMQAGASRPVRDAERLGRAVEEFLSPDRAADFARRAWEVVSEGAEATDRVADQVGRILDGAR